MNIPSTEPPNVEPLLAVDEPRKQNLLKRIRGQIRGKEASFIQALNSVPAHTPLHEDMLYLTENLLPGDLAWLDGHWLKKWAMDSRDIMALVPWAADIPQEIYRNFVLPFRVNNETIDYERKQFFAQLWPRLVGAQGQSQEQGLACSMEEAALNINHYCYEQVRYTATDIRTLGPAALLQRGLGRCGEQSVLLVALLRSVAIPARQCYVSRWSHTESNHAWVEVWNGQDWHYLGACEPEPTLDTGWFGENAARAVLVQTRVGNRNYSAEPVLSRESTHSIVNITKNYAPTVDLRIRVCFQNQRQNQWQQQWIAGAQAQISVFNGGEFFPLHRFSTAADGWSEAFSIGCGDILLEVFWQDCSYWQIHSIDNTEQDSLVIHCELQGELQEATGKTERETERYFNFCPAQPPQAKAIQRSNKPTAQKIASHQLQMKAGEMAYQAKMASFQTEIFARKALESRELSRCCHELKITPDEWYGYFHSAGCGAKELYQAWEQLFPRFGMALWWLLQSISEKERAFVTVFDLEDFLEHALIYKENYRDNLDIWREYVLAPQVDFEPVGAHRRKIYRQLSRQAPELFSRRPNVSEVLAWIQNNIVQEDEHYFFYYRSSLPPLDSFALKKADKISYKVLQVAILRIFGYAARFNQSILAIEWLENGQWQSEYFSKQGERAHARLALHNLEKLSPSIQISIGMRPFPPIKEKSDQKHLPYQALYCGEVHAQQGQHGETQGLANLLNGALPCGFYRVCLGVRNEKGNVRGWIHHFTLEEQQEKNITLPVLIADTESKIYATVHSGVIPYTGTELQIYIAKDKINEPFYHFLHDISNHELCGQLNFLFVEQDGDELGLYLRNFLKETQIHFIPKFQASQLESAIASWDTGSFPKIFLLRGRNIIFFHCGYSRNIVSQLANKIATP